MNRAACATDSPETLTLVDALCMQRIRAFAMLFAVLAVASWSTPAAAQSTPRPSDLREIHSLAVYATVRIETRTGWGTGWLLAQSGRPVVITNAHVVRQMGRRAARVLFYAGSDQEPPAVIARVAHVSARIDLAFLRLQADPPASARPITMRASATVVRGERVVLGGNPVDDVGSSAVPLPFQMTEGVVTGHVAGASFAPCGAGRNCIVVDAASMGGSSGGPAFNVEGELVGMLWGGPVLGGEHRTVAVAVDARGDVTAAAVGRGRTEVQNPAFTYLIHARTIADELRSIERR